MFPRVLKAFQRVRALLWACGWHGAFPTVSTCAQADADQERSWRQFAHALCKDEETVCVAQEANAQLTDAELFGGLLHEVGHIIASINRLPAHMAASHDDSDKTPEPVQAEADSEIFRITGLRIFYNQRTLQEVDVKAFEELERRFGLQ